ncbi:TRAP transporter large permease [Gudongella sp. DL1XJH-153]|uniref:TRAP transporter large permease n=1 Tax=Gudongella sp. DL1XJH-153 TaxID=3409804 RepID=UPI003BB77AE4
MTMGIFFGLAVILLVLGVPIAMTVGLASIIFIIGEGIQLSIVIQRLFSGIDVTALLAIPFFVLAGELMGKGGIANRLVRLASRGVGDKTGGLAMVAIITCMFFAAISGSGVATAAAIGGIMIPGMVIAKYDKSFAAAVISTAAPIGVIIPPSISFVQYGVLTGSSIADLYKAGIPAGFIIGASLMITAYIISKKRGYKIEKDENQNEPRKSDTYSKRDLIEVLWALGTPIIIVGGVFGGIFTPTESAVVAVVYALLVGIFIFKELKVNEIMIVFKNSAITSSRIMFIIANATLFSWVMTYQRIPQMIMENMLSMTDNTFLLLLIINIVLLIAGTFMETGSIILIATPLLLPIINFIGMDLTHFGILLTVNTAIGLTTPPFGVCLFTTANVAGLSVQAISKEVVYFIMAMIVGLMIITYFPQTVMFMV